MKRVGLKSSSVFMAAACAAAIAFAPAASADRYASIVVDADTHEVLHARNADAERYPASLTKVMTLYMVFDALKEGELALDENLYVSQNAASQPPSNLRLRAGQWITVDEAIRALVSKSANDVAVVIAERLGGTEERFAALMTVKATTLGLEHTRFYNASGLPDARQVSTARDLSRLGEAVLEDHSDYYAYFSERSFSWGRATYRNHNELLGRVDGVDGIKTGYTRASGFNLLASAERDGRRVIAVMLGGRTSRARNAHVTDLIEAAFSAFDTEEAVQTGMHAGIAFDAIRQPVGPNDAAQPTLNGRPLPVAEGAGR